MNYATQDGTAKAGVDYSPNSGTLTFAAGETTKIIAIPILSNPSQSNAVSMVVKLTAPSSGSLGTDSAVVTITAAPFKVIAPTWAGVGGTESYIRVFNADTTARSVTFTVMGDFTGNTYGSATYTIPPMAAPQKSLTQILQAANTGPIQAGDSGYSLQISSIEKVFFQHVIWNGLSGLFENVSACTATAGADYTALNQTLIDVDTSVIVSYPATIYIRNNSDTANNFAVHFFDSETGNAIGSGTTLSIPARATRAFAETQLETALSWQPLPQQAHVNLLFSVAGALPFPGVLSHFVANSGTGSFANMTPVCPTF